MPATPLRRLMDIDAWRQATKGRPASEAPFDAMLLKEGASAVDGDRNIVFIMSTGAVDRVGDVLSVDGWDLTSYRQNPVWLWAHQRDQIPIAKSLREWVENGQLKSELVFQDFELARVVEKSIRGGFLNACSVGFRPTEWSYNEGRGSFATDFLQQELLECSVVPVPCNPEALVAAKAAGIGVRCVIP